MLGSAIDIGGADVVTGPGLAQALAAGLDRAVTYEALPVHVFETALAPVFGADTASGIAAAYHLVGSADGTGLYDGDPVKVEGTFGVELTPLRDWIAAQLWKALG